MRRRTHRWENLVQAIVVASILFSTTSLAAADWPQYRGPHRDGRSSETGLLRSWPKGGPEEIWRVPLGSGYSGIAVVGDRLFTLLARDDSEMVAAYSTSNGAELWRLRLDAERPDSQGEGPRSTPTVDGEQIYVVGARGQLASLAAATGSVEWRIDLREKLGAKVPQWGVSSSPLVEGDRLIVEVGGGNGSAFAAFNKETGEVVWSSGSSKPGYASPIAVTLQGRRQIVFFPASGLVGVAPENGEVLWSVPWKTSYDVNAATPIFVPRDSIFISSGYDSGAALVAVERDDDSLTADFAWKNREMKNHFNSSVLVGNFIYGFDNAIFKCLDARSGAEIWKARGGYGKGASLLYADGLLFVLGGEGLLGLVEATPEGYRELATAEVSSRRTWTMPSLANGVLYLRDFRELWALRVGS